MKTDTTRLDPAGFSLIETLIALALCALLAIATAAAISFTSRVERIAERNGEASLLLQSLYASQHLRPDDLPPAPPGWRVDHSTDIIAYPDAPPREWHVLTVIAREGDLPPFSLRILDDTP